MGHKTATTTCPCCGDEAVSKTTDSRAKERFGMTLTVRRRLCAGCGGSWSTIEIPEDALPAIMSGRSHEIVAAQMIAVLTDEFLSTKETTT